jgi:hypothetical protein
MFTSGCGHVCSSYNTGANIARHSSILFGCNHLLLGEGRGWHDALACRDDICNVDDNNALEDVIPADDDDNDVSRDVI